MCHSTWYARKIIRSIQRKKQIGGPFSTYVAVQQPGTGVIGSESDRSRSAGGYGDGVSSHRVLLLDDGRVELGVVREIVGGFAHDLELVSVQMEGMETGVTERSRGISQGSSEMSVAALARLRVNDGDLNHSKVVEHQSVGHRSVNPGVVRVVAHGHLGEQCGSHGHLVGAVKRVEQVVSPGQGALSTQGKCDMLTRH